MRKTDWTVRFEKRADKFDREHWDGASDLLYILIPVAVYFLLF